MYGDRRFFYELKIRTPLVVRGHEGQLPDGEHKRATVYRTMILQISRDYSSLPDVRTLTSGQIRFYYDGLRPELLKGD